MVLVFGVWQVHTLSAIPAGGEEVNSDLRQPEEEARCEKL